MDAQLRNLAEVTCQSDDYNWTSSELAERISGFDAVITSWGTPKFTDDVLVAADQLKLIAHSRTFALGW